jgi:hypothetical protein
MVGLSSRITPLQQRWLEWEAERRFDGELSRTLRWALDQARAFTFLMMNEDPVTALDVILNPDKYEPPDPDVDGGPTEAERHAELQRREVLIKNAFSLGEPS